ncbi:hypothetical protein Mithridates_00042 [Acinetobacter phage Mithridates]|nr:hypothetical protein Mithridates_00042 [Acinetobacter phage Mithridates]
MGFRIQDVYCIPSKEFLMSLENFTAVPIDFPKRKNKYLHFGCHIYWLYACKEYSATSNLLWNARRPSIIEVSEEKFLEIFMILRNQNGETGEELDVKIKAVIDK